MYLFERHPEIAALRLSEILFHEIGHHTHYFKRPGIKIKQQEDFAGRYGQVGYFNYMLYRKNKIISSYKWGARNILESNKENRRIFKYNLNSIVEWFKNNKININYPKLNAYKRQ